MVIPLSPELLSLHPPPLKLQNSWKSVNKGLGIGSLPPHLWKCRIPGNRVNHIDSVHALSPLPPLKLQNSWKSVNKGLGIGSFPPHLWKCRIPGNRVNHIDSVHHLSPPTSENAEFLEIEEIILKQHLSPPTSRNAEFLEIEEIILTHHLSPPTSRIQNSWKSRKL